MNERLLALALSSLDANVETLDGRRLITAGRNQFRSLWTRDFCFAAFGLLCHGRQGVVRDHLETLLSHRGQEALVPRSLDSMSTQWRVVLATLRRVFGRLIPAPTITAKLRAEYRGEHGTPQIDGNALVAIVAERYAQASGDSQWWDRHVAAVRELVDGYSEYMKDGLLHQPGFSDWQDSVRRDGASFFANLLLWRARQAVGLQDDELRQRLVQTFQREDGIFLSLENSSHVSIDGNLLALEFDFVRGQQAHALYERLKAHPLWSAAGGIPGAVTHPDYPKSWVSWTTKMVGLRHYHDRLAWSWLSGLAIRICRKMGDAEEAKRIAAFLTDVVERDGAVAEVYEPSNSWPRVKRILYRSEMPFAWGAGMIAYGLEDGSEA